MTNWEKEQREWLIAESKKAIVKYENKKALVWTKLNINEHSNRQQIKRMQAMMRHYDRQIAKEKAFLAIA